MPTQQPILMSTANPSDNGTTEYLRINSNTESWTSVLTNQHLLWPAAGNLKELNIEIDTAPSGVGVKWTFAIMVNGVASALTGDIENTATTLTVTTDVALAVGDTVTIRCVPTGTPNEWTKFDANIIWEPTTDDEYVLLGGHATNLLHATSLEYSPVNGGGSQTWGGARAKRASPTPFAGTIKNLTVLADATPGVGKTYTFRIDNGGTGSTETVVINDGDEGTAKTNTNTIDTPSAGDGLTFSCTPSGTPNTIKCLCSCVFVPTTSGNVPLMGGSGDNTMDLVATEFLSPGEQNTLTATRSLRQIKLVNIEIIVEAVYYLFNATTGGSGYDLKFEVDGVDQTALNVSINGSSTSGNATGASVTVSAGESINFEKIPQGSPTTARTCQHGLKLSFGASSPAVFTPRHVIF